MLRYDKIIIVDLETTGLDHYVDKIIEFGAVVLHKEPTGRKFVVTKEIQEIVNPGHPITAEITGITGITNDMIREQGIAYSEFGFILEDLFVNTNERTLLMAYNTQFDYSFIQVSLNKFRGKVEILPHDMIDVLTMYRDGHEFPHKLINAITELGLAGKVVNSHRAYDDALAAWEVFKALYVKPMTYGVKTYQPMQYLNAIGYKAKYGINGVKFPQCNYHGITNKKFCVVEKQLRSMVE